MGFSRQEYWSGLPFPSPGDLPDPGIEPRPPALEADALTSEPPGNTNIGLSDQQDLVTNWLWSTTEKVTSESDSRAPAGAEAGDKVLQEMLS